MIKSKKNKLTLSRDEEFQLMKIIYDKFLWLGTAGLGVGLYMLMRPTVPVEQGLLILVTGALILLIFTASVMRNLHFHRKF